LASWSNRTPATFDVRCKRVGFGAGLGGRLSTLAGGFSAATPAHVLEPPIDAAYEPHKGKRKDHCQQPDRQDERRANGCGRVGLRLRLRIVRRGLPAAAGNTAEVAAAAVR